MNFDDSIINNNLKCNLQIDKDYENKIDEWLKTDRYKNLNNHQFKIKKTCIFNEHYLGYKLSLLKERIIDLRKN